MHFHEFLCHNCSYDKKKNNSHDDGIALIQLLIDDRRNKAWKKVARMGLERRDSRLS